MSFKFHLKVIWKYVNIDVNLWSCIFSSRNMLYTRLLFLYFKGKPLPDISDNMMFKTMDNKCESQLIGRGIEQLLQNFHSWLENREDRSCQYSYHTSDNGLDEELTDLAYVSLQMFG